MRKTLALLLNILLCLPGAFSLAEEAGKVEQETFTCGDYEYALLDDGTAEITKYHGEAEALEVPGELDGYAVTAIGDGAFYGCFGLTDVTIPGSVTAIGDSAFALCFGLTAIAIPDSLTTIGANPFYHCENLTQITVSPDHPVLETIGGVLFNKPDKRLVTYPCAFTDSEYAIPQGITTIGDSAFSCCDSLTAITIPDSVTTIGNEAFSFCSSLTSITLPDSVTSIGLNPFISCEKLRRILISPDNKTLETIDGVLFSKPDRRLVYYPNAFTMSEYKVPEGTEIIGDSAFIGCSSLIAVTVPDSVTAIGNDAFYNCNSLTEIFVGRDSYAKQYCIDHDLPYTYTDANDWPNG